MVKNYTKTNKNFKHQNGFSLVEVLLSMFIFSLFVTALAGAVIYGEQSVVMSGLQERANFLAEEGIEAVRSIRDGNYLNLSDGDFGLKSENNVWSLASSPDVAGVFTRKITITSLSPSSKQIISTVTWQASPQRAGSISLYTLLTNWRGN